MRRGRRFLVLMVFAMEQSSDVVEERPKSPKHVIFNAKLKRQQFDESRIMLK